jgi:hypothetical protein
MSQGLRNTINNAKVEAAYDNRLSWEDMCNPRKSSWTRNLTKAVQYKTNEDGELVDVRTGKIVMFGGVQNKTDGKPDKTASEAMHMAWKTRDFEDKKLDKDVVKNAFATSNLKIVWLSQFTAGHLWSTKFAKVNEIKGKPEIDEHFNINVEGKPVYHLKYILTGNRLDRSGIYKMFTYGDKYVLIQTGFQKFVLCMIKDPKTNRIINKQSDFERLSTTPQEKKQMAANEKKYGWLKNLQKDIEKDYKRRRGEIGF